MKFTFTKEFDLKALQDENPQFQSWDFKDLSDIHYLFCEAEEVTNAYGFKVFTIESDELTEDGANKLNELTVTVDFKQLSHLSFIVEQASRAFDQDESPTNCNIDPEALEYIELFLMPYGDDTAFDYHDSFVSGICELLLFLTIDPKVIYKETAGLIIDYTEN